MQQILTYCTKYVVYICIFFILTRFAEKILSASMINISELVVLFFFFVYVNLTNCGSPNFIIKIEIVGKSTVFFFFWWYTQGGNYFRIIFKCIANLYLNFYLRPTYFLPYILLQKNIIIYSFSI